MKLAVWSFHFGATSRVCVKLAWQLDENTSLVILSLSISAPCFHFSSLCMLTSPPTPTSSDSLIYPPVFSSSFLSWLFHPLFAPIPSNAFLFYQPPLSSLGHLSTSPCVSALQSSQSQLCPSQQHRSGNESLPSGAWWHRALLSPGSVGAGQSGVDICLRGSGLLRWDHHTGTWSACNVG